MSRLTSVFPYVLSAAIACCVSSTARACVPIGGTEPPCSAYWKADAVFVGRIIDISKVPREPKETFEKLLLHFSVEQPYRGVESTEVDVTSTTGTDCDTKFQHGERWLVYARRNGAAGKLEIWMRTTLLADADEDLSYIQSLSQATAETAVIGGVYEYPYTPWEGIKIRVAGNGMKYETETDKQGQFKVPSVKPGKYTVRATFPPKTAATGFGQPSRVRERKNGTVVEFEQEVQAGRCGFVQFLVFKPRNIARR